MTKIILIGLTSILLSGCYDEPFAYPPTYLPGYVYNQPPEPYRPDWRYRPGYAAPGYREPPPAAESAEPDSAARSPDDEEVIGADEPQVDRSGMRVTRQPQVTRHRDHSSDYKP